MNKNYIFIDPDGTCGQWIYLIVHAKTSIIYSTQCSGLDNEVRCMEGYLIPLGGVTFDTQYDLTIEIQNLKQLFCKRPNFSLHYSKHIPHLKKIIENITIWFSSSLDSDDQRHHLSLNNNKIEEITEAWIPVISPYGEAVLVWKNSD